MKHQLLLILAVLFFATSVRAAESMRAEGEWTLGFQAGVVTGQLSSPQLANYGGFPVGIALTRNLTEKVELQFQFQFVIDAQSYLLTRLGAGTGIAYSLLGGAANWTEDYGETVITRRWPFSFSVLLRTELNKYDAGVTSSANSPIVTGGALEFYAGLQYRLSVSTRSSIFLEGLVGMFDLPIDLQRTSGNLYEVTIGYKFSI